MATQPAFEAEEPAGNFLQRLGLLRARSPLDEDVGAEPVVRVDPRARRRLLNDIRAFLIDNDLEVTPFNLLAAQEACSGLNPKLARNIAWRRECGEPITQRWLEEATADDPCTSNRSIEDLAKELERGIDELSRATKSMRQATSEYGDELERRVAAFIEPLRRDRPVDPGVDVLGADPELLHAEAAVVGVFVVAAGVVSVL